MLSLFPGSVFRLLFLSLSIMDLGCLGMSFGITPHQLTRVTSSAVGSCFSPSCIIQSYIDLTIGL